MGLISTAQMPATKPACSGLPTQEQQRRTHHSVLDVRVLRAARQPRQQNEHWGVLRQLLAGRQVLGVQRHAAAVWPARQFSLQAAV